MEEPPRRTSGRIRVAPDFFVSEPEPEKPVNKKRSATKSSHSTNSINGKSDKSKAHLTPEPHFTLIQSEQPSSLIWLRLHLREFILRFDSCLNLSKRHFSAILNPIQPWNEYMYKAIIVCFLEVIYDKKSMDYAVKNPNSGEESRKKALESASSYKDSIMACSPESERMWSFLDEFCDSVKDYLDRDRFGDEAEDEDDDQSNSFNDSQELKTKQNTCDHDEKRLMILHKLMILTVSSTKIRLLMNEDQDQIKKLQTQTSDKIRQSKAAWEKATENLAKETPQDQAWKEKYARIKNSHIQEQFDLERNLYFENMFRSNLRSKPLGIDHLGNTYWIFQQQYVSGNQSKSVLNQSSWGYGWVLVEKGQDLFSPISRTEKKTKINKEMIHPPKRVKLVTGKNQNDSLYFIEGASDIRVLVNWLKNEQSNAQLARDLEKYAKYI